MKKQNFRVKMTDLWNRFRSDIQMDNATKAEIAEETVQTTINEIQSTLDPQKYGHFQPDSETCRARESHATKVSPDYELAEYESVTPEESGHHHHFKGRLYILRRKV